MEAPTESSRWLSNPAKDPAWTAPQVAGTIHAYHRTLAGYAPTSLIELPEVARRLGVRHVVAKDESRRFELPAFKGLGASWAIYRTVRERAAQTPSTIVTATDGNHGRAVARFARELGHHARIFLPDGVHPAAVQAIADEGAEVVRIADNYDAAVRAAAAYAQETDGALLVQDTSWPGYEDVPQWIVDGYSTLFQEIDDQLEARDLPRPDLVMVPTGVGSLLQAALVHYRRSDAAHETQVVSVEPTAAPCVLQSVAAGEPVTVDTGQTIMAGLNCGTVSSLAWPVIRSALDGCVVVPDGVVAQAARDLQAAGVDAGPCGAASLAALEALAGALDSPPTGVGRSAPAGSPLGPDSTVVLLVTEGAAANPALTADTASDSG